jgi:threonine dehydrogenase-like Zn-dependent dehydrogenase
MKALVYTRLEKLEFKDVPDPVRANGDNLIRVEAVGICGSDMHAFLGHDERRPAPLILGHEVAGLVIEGPMAGRWVTVNPLVTCGMCRACLEGRTNLCPTRQLISMPPREGGFAELLSMPSANLVEVPDDVPPDKAALAEPLAVCWHAVKLCEQVLFNDLPDVRALVIGGGAIGVGSALSLRAFGTRDITIAEPNAERAAYGMKKTGFKTISPDHVPANDYDLIIDAVGYRATREAACRAVRPGGAICHIGLGDSEDGLDIRRMTLQEITFFGSYVYTMQDFRETAQAMFDGRLGALDWTEARALSDGGQAFADLLGGRVTAPKIILHP